MHTFVLQDWITISGQYSTLTSLGLNIIQNQAEWLDLSPFQDLFAWIAISEVTPGTSGSVDLYLETSPTDDESFFQSMTGPSTPVISGATASDTPTVIKLPMLSATVPLSRFLRWRLKNSGLVSTGTWDITMRIVVAANSPGM